MNSAVEKDTLVISNAVPDVLSVDDLLLWVKHWTVRGEVPIQDGLVSIPSIVDAVFACARLRHKCFFLEDHVITAIARLIIHRELTMLAHRCPAVAFAEETDFDLIEQLCNILVANICTIVRTHACRPAAPEDMATTVNSLTMDLLELDVVRRAICRRRGLTVHDMNAQNLWRNCLATIDGMREFLWQHQAACIIWGGIDINSYEGLGSWDCGICLVGGHPFIRDDSPYDKRSTQSLKTGLRAVAQLLQLCSECAMHHVVHDGVDKGQDRVQEAWNLVSATLLNRATIEVIVLNCHPCFVVGEGLPPPPPTWLGYARTGMGSFAMSFTLRYFNALLSHLGLSFQVLEEDHSMTGSSDQAYTLAVSWLTAIKNRTNGCPEQIRNVMIASFTELFDVRYIL